jgi:hypothetical protein
VLLDDEQGELTISSPATILADSGRCWVGAVVDTAQAGTFDAVLIVDTGAGGELCGGYLWDGHWFHLDELVRRAGVARGDVYPFDYSLKVRLEVDHFH